MSRRLYAFSVTLCSHIFMLAATVCGFIFGILALIPAGPFQVQNLTLGIILIVLSVFPPIIGCIGALTGALIASIVCAPLLCCEA